MSYVRKGVGAKACRPYRGDGNCVNAGIFGGDGGEIEVRKGHQKSEVSGD